MTGVAARERALGREQGSGTRALPGRAAAGVVVLSAWLGAVLLFSLVVAPAAFRVLPTRAAAGRLVGAVLPALFLTGLAAGLMAVLLAAGAPRSRSRVVRMSAGVVVILACAAGQFVLAPRIERVRARMPAAVDALPAGAPLRVEFGRLHAQSVGALGLAAVAAIIAVGASVAGAGGARLSPIRGDRNAPAGGR